MIKEVGNTIGDSLSLKSDPVLNRNSDVETERIGMTTMRQNLSFFIGQSCPVNVPCIMLQQDQGLAHHYYLQGNCFRETQASVTAKQIKGYKKSLEALLISVFQLPHASSNISIHCIFSVDLLLFPKNLVFNKTFGLDDFPQLVGLPFQRQEVFSRRQFSCYARR